MKVTRKGLGCVFLLVSTWVGASSYVEIRSGLCNPTEAGAYRYRNTATLSCEWGRTFFQNFRLGFQLGYTHFDCSNAGKLLAGGHPMNLGNAKCRSYAFSVFLNCYCDHQFSSQLEGFVGLGFGKTRIRLFSHTLDAFASDYFNSDAKFVFACQLVTGFVYRLSEAWSLVADYRCQKMENFEMETRDSFVFEYYSTVRTPLLHCFEVGLRYTF